MSVLLATTTGTPWIPTAPEEVTDPCPSCGRQLITETPCLTMTKNKRFTLHTKRCPGATYRGGEYVAACKYIDQRFEEVPMNLKEGENNEFIVDRDCSGCGATREQDHTVEVRKIGDNVFAVMCNECRAAYPDNYTRERATEIGLKVAEPAVPLCNCGCGKPTRKVSGQVRKYASQACANRHNAEKKRREKERLKALDKEVHEEQEVGLLGRTERELRNLIGSDLFGYTEAPLPKPESQRDLTGIAKSPSPEKDAFFAVLKLKRTEVLEAYEKRLEAQVHHDRVAEDLSILVKASWILGWEESR